MAISRKRKDELVVQYVDWLKRSQAVILTDYRGLSMKDVDELRSKARNIGGEFHIIKNSLGKIAFDDVGLEVQEDYLVGTNAIAFAFEDAAALAKVVHEFARESDFLKIKGGYLEGQVLNSAEIKALANLPPLPVMRAKLLGTIMAPANQLARTLAEPARQMAAVLKAYSEQETTTAPA